MLTLVILLAVTCLSLIQAVRSFILIRLGGWLDTKLSPVLFAHGVSAFAQKKGVSGSQHLQDLNSIKGFLTGAAINSLLDAPWSIIFTITLFFIHPTLGYISIIGGLVLLTLAIINEIVTKPALEASNEHTMKSSSCADTASRNAEAIEAMGMLTNITTIWHESSDKARSLQAVSSSRSAIISSITRFLRLTIQIGVTGVGAYLVLENQMTVGGMIAAGILVGRALAPFETSIASWKGFVFARKALSRLRESLENSPVRLQGIDLPDPKGIVSVENAYFVPAGSKKPTLSEVNMRIEEGEALAIIGPSAAGKSTLAKLLTGVWKASSGNVRLDNADVYSWSRETFGKHIGYLPQDIELFSGTVKANIARMNMEASDESVIKAAQDAGVHELVLRLPNGYDTEIGIDGGSLSAGQRQRIALARAFYGEPKFIVLDEPNASLDNAGDIALLNAIKGAKERGITVIIISHRPAILKSVDKILVLNEGRVAEFGGRDEVINKISGERTPQLRAANAG